MSAGIRDAVPQLPADPRGAGVRHHGGQLERGRLPEGHRQALPAQCRGALLAEEGTKLIPVHTRELFSGYWLPRNFSFRPLACRHLEVMNLNADPP